MFSLLPKNGRKVNKNCLSMNQGKLRRKGWILFRVEENYGQEFKFNVTFRSNSEQAQIQSWQVVKSKRDKGVGVTSLGNI